MNQPVPRSTQHAEHVEYVEYVEEDDGWTQPTTSYNLASRTPQTPLGQPPGVPDAGDFDPGYDDSGYDPGYDPGFG